MTLEELQAKREEILQRIGVVRAAFGDRSVEYEDAQQALSTIDAEIEKLSSTPSSSNRTSYARFRKGSRG